MKLLRFIALCMLLVITPSLSAKKIFPTLSALNNYAHSVPEYVDAENESWLNPSFTAFHKSLRPGVARKLFSWVGLGYKAWNAYGFKKILKETIRKRELSGEMGDFIQKYVPKMGDSILIWTDLFGAFHSLVRDLLELQSNGIIDDRFKIVKPGYIFVFNGNVINHSPYVLETLSVVIRLLRANPEKVIYIRGNHEERQEWHSYGLARELKIRASSLSGELIPLNKQVTRFFNTLPLGLYIPEVGDKVIDLVLIANNHQSEAGFKEKNFAGFFEQEESHRLSSLKLANKMPSKKKVKVRAVITGEDRSISYRQTEGLTMLGTKREATAWLVFSSPTGRNRRLYDFFYDAFAELSIVNGIDDWTISLFNQDVRKLLGFQKVATYNLLTGQQIREGRRKVSRIAPKQKENEPVSEKSPEKSSAPKASLLAEPSEKEEEQAPGYEGEKESITIGATMDLSKSASTIGKPFKEGMDLAFAKMSRDGGAGAFLPRIVVYDDEYTPSKTRNHLKNFQENVGVDTFLNSVGSPTNQTYIPLAQEKKVLNLFPYTGAPIFRKPDLDHFAHYRVGYVDEGRALAEYALDNLNAKKIVIFYQNDAFGKGALQGAMEVLNERGHKDVLKVPYERNDVQYDQQAKKIEQADPDTIFFFAVTPSAKSLIRLMGVPFFKGKNLIGMSVYDESFDRFLEQKGLTFLMVRMVPNPKTSDIEIVKEYREEAERANHVPNLISLEGYINAHIFFELLKRIKPPYTKEKIIEQLKNIKNYSMKGIELNFNPETHELGKALWLDTGEGPWIEKKVRDKKPGAKKIAPEQPKEKEVQEKAKPIKKEVGEPKKDTKKLEQKKKQ